MARKPSVWSYFRVGGQLRALDWRVGVLTLLMFVCLTHQTDAAEYMTMVTPTPYGAGSYASLTCFRTSSNNGVTLSYGRPFPIDLSGSTIQTSTSLPAHTSSTTSQAESRDFSNTNDAVGVFYCQGGNDESTRVYSIIHSINRKFEPQNGLVTRTINSGEGVTLTVTSYNNGGSPLWRRIRNGAVTSLDLSSFSTTRTITSTDAINGDVYAVIQSAAFLTDNHFSMIRLIVRGCAEGKWSPADCTGICDMCYNGGVCDDVTGQCICAPGFTGTNCLTLCGQNIFGWNCDLQCGGSNIIQSCIGSQFGLPDPYGNSCISGYTGTHCDTACSAGTFGAGCTQICHCQSGVCNPYTGVCLSEGCTTGWSGANCQIPDVCPQGYYGYDCTSKCNCPNDAACDNGVCSTVFAITCAASGNEYGYPGSSISVTIPQPTVTTGVSGVTFTYTLNGFQQPITNPYPVAVPMSWTTTASVTVTGTQSSLDLQGTCVYSFTVTGFGLICETGNPVYGNPGSPISVMIPDPNVIGGVSGVTFKYTLSGFEQPISNPYSYTVPTSATEILSVTVTGSLSGNVEQTCTYTVTITAFEITCADSVPVYGDPGSTISVMIPEPTVTTGVSGVTFTYTLSSTQQPITNPYPVTLPMSGTTTVSVTVTVSQYALGLEGTCVQSITVTDVVFTCADSEPVYGNPGTTINVMIPEPTVPEGVSGVTFYIMPSYEPISMLQEVQVPVTGSSPLNVTVVGLGPSGSRASCMYTTTVTAFEITCGSNATVYGDPGTTMNVTIPQPTGTAGVSDVTFTYTLSSTQQTITTPYLVTVPMSGTTSVSVTVIGSQSALGLQGTCMYSMTVTGLPELSQPPLVSVTSSSASLSWQPWGVNQTDTGNGPVTQYNVYYAPASTMDWVNAGNITVSNPSQDMYSFVIEALVPDTQYAFSVSAVSEGGEGPMSPVAEGMTLQVPTTAESTTVASTTSKGVGPPPPGPESSIMVVIPVVVVVALLVLLVVLVVVLVMRVRRRHQSRRLSTDNLNGKFESNNDLVSLQTIENPVMSQSEEGGSNGSPVIPDPTPERPLSATSQISTLDSSSPFAGLPLLPSGERELKRDPVPIKDFPDYVHTGIQSGQFVDEWKSFPGMEAMCSCDISQQTDNKSKNRYRNIPAYDHSRVKLDVIEDNKQTDYINASYIKGYNNDKAYIATQGPFPHTCVDFWLMVWQENIHVIVMGANLVEAGKGKCAQYWPDKGCTTMHGDINVNLLDEQIRGQYVVRTMNITNLADESKSRTVTQFHYTTWPDKDVPKDVTPVLELIQEFTDASPPGAGPYLIHCSAGVGRTGAIIGIHASLQHAHAQKTIDIYNLVAVMRDHRVSIVQTPTQYAFIHVAVLESLFAANTSTPATELKKKIAELKKKKKLQNEMEQLRIITPPPDRDNCYNSINNADKNRFPKTVFCDAHRPFLMTPREDGSEYNYINAVFINGYKNIDTTVVTQSPMPSTVLDLWRLVFDYNISKIVMLDALDPSDEDCPIYWPEKGSQDYGPFTITNMGSKNLPGFLIQTLRLVHRRQKRTHFLLHYRLTNWPKNLSVPKSPDSLLRLALHLDKEPVPKASVRRHHRSDPPVLLHCIDALNRSGAFCVLKNSLDRLLDTETVDIMQTTKLLRLKRPHMLNNPSLYLFCYEAMQAYISNPERFQAPAEPEAIYQNMPRKSGESDPENIYQNFDPKEAGEDTDL